MDMKTAITTQLANLITQGAYMKKHNLISKTLLACCAIASSHGYAVQSFDPMAMPVGTAPRPTVTSQNVGSGKEYQFFAWHEADKFKGNLDAYKLDSAGKVVGLPIWRTSKNVVSGVTTPGALDSQASRNIVTYKGAAKVAFNAANFSTVTTLNLGADATTRTNVINYLRGDRSKEKTATNTAGIFRERAALLGDIMHSSPVFVGAPKGGDGTASFTTFRNLCRL
jgi:Tfp pilus tip-associated adhesin PilY1